jgi:hypothetical protein
MKKIIAIALSVLCSTLVFAKRTEGPAKTGSSVAVLSNAHSNLVKVVYRAPMSGKVKITIRNEKNELIFSETIKQRDGFMRPYNFGDLAQGSYTVQVEDAFGTQIEKVNYHRVADRFIRLMKLTGDVEKVLVLGNSGTEDEIIVRIFDRKDELLFEEARKVSGPFGEVYNLKNLAAPFTVQVSNANGLLKTLSYE